LSISVSNLETKKEATDSSPSREPPAAIRFSIPDS
jgi:hypothetical protein